jgi:hypothetical protein
VVTAEQRRQAVRQLQQTFGVSQRRACCVLRQPRSTQRQTAKTSAEEERLIRRMLSGATASALGLPTHQRIAATGGLACQPQTGVPAVAEGRAESAPQAAEKAAVGPQLLGRSKPGRHLAFARGCRELRLLAGRGPSPAPLSQERQVFADAQTRRLCGHATELVANVGGSIGLGIEAVDLRQTAGEENVDDAAGFWNMGRIGPTGGL